MAVIIRDVSSLRLAEKLDRNFCDPGTFAKRVGVARIERGDAAQLVAGGELDQLGEPSADHDDIGGMKGQGQPLGGVFVAAGIVFKRVVAQLRGKTRPRVRIGPELDVISAAHAVGVFAAGRSGGPLRFLLPFFFG